ncbi:hypothetical protein RRG08_050006 [Elysia crispata]|uniref:EF-hand domain-containing protein n=1 Tax=Elysia crispata TaxID=231223 RepID=A0AAE1B9M9_9GAST|nr:hypothetical protein RRG08_050006 [Elysia crispata]
MSKFIFLSLIQQKIVLTPRSCLPDDKRVGARARVYSDNEMSQWIEAALTTEDQNNDGYIEYWEFMAAQSKRRHPQPPGNGDTAV